MHPLFLPSSSSVSSTLFLLLLLLLLLTLQTLGAPRSSENCGNFSLSFPFHLSSSSSSAFRLSCTNQSTLFLHLNHQTYRIIELFSDGLLVDFPSSPPCRQFHDLRSFPFSKNQFFSISFENVIGLYDCEDSSLCKPSCETNDLFGCDGKEEDHGGDIGCCYPLSDHTAWREGDDFSVFGKYGCRGFFSWVVPRGMNRGKRGVKLEWAIPRNSSESVCDGEARSVNASGIEGSVRCVCRDGFVGDGFVHGTGCIRSCYREGKEVYGDKCHINRHKRHNGKKLTVLAGVLAPLFILGSLLTLFCLLKRPMTTTTHKDQHFNHSQSHSHSQSQSPSPTTTIVSFRKSYTKTRLFTYRELEEATKGFQDSNKLTQGKTGEIYLGNLQTGTRVIVHKVLCENHTEFLEISTQLDHLSAVLHRNLARIIGFCMDIGYNPLAVYEYPVNGSLEERLKLGLDWGKRVNIVAEVAGLLALLQYENYPSIVHDNVASGYIFLDEDFQAKVTGFGLLKKQRNSVCVMYDFAVLLLEIVTGLKQREVEAVTQTLQWIRNGKLEEMVDPSLKFHEQPLVFREQIGLVADIATRCVLFGGDEKFGMVDAARELLLIAEINSGCDKKGDTIEETFSNSSLLQMISTSPDSICLPKT